MTCTPYRWNTLVYLFGSTVFTFISLWVGASENITAYIDIDLVVFIVFGSPYPPASPNKPVVSGVRHLPGAQGGVGAGSVGVSASVPRWNSLGDLKIPARISQAQVGPRRDLGVVREFAMDIER